MKTIRYKQTKPKKIHAYYIRYEIEILYLIFKELYSKFAFLYDLIFVLSPIQDK